MASKDTGKAIGMVGELLQQTLLNGLPSVQSDLLTVRVGRPEDQADKTNTPLINLYLYECKLDEHMRNKPLRSQGKNPLWLVLRYLLTAFDEKGKSDTVAAQGYLGEAAQLFHDLGYLPLEDATPAPSAELLAALSPNPEPLKLTFDDANSELLARLMQGSNERYRCSLAFQVRPVMIASLEAPAVSQLVGWDYTKMPAADVSLTARQIEVIASLPPLLERTVPTKLRLEQAFLVLGKGLEQENLAGELGGVALEALMASGGEIQFSLASLADGKRLSPGQYPFRVVRKLKSGHLLGSNWISTAILPLLEGVEVKNLAMGVDPMLKTPLVTADLVLSGKLLGKPGDQVSLVLLKAGKAMAVFDELNPVPGPAQGGWALSIGLAAGLAPGSYRLLLLVNGEQAELMPMLELQP